MLKKTLFLIISLMLAFSVTACRSSDKAFGECNHVWVEIPKDGAIASEKTCMSAAFYFSVCFVCSEKGTPYSYGEIGTHRYGENEIDGHVITPPTCTEGGVYYKSCDFCGEACEETFIGATLEKHDYKELVSDEAMRDPATCVSGAVYYESCTVCGGLGESVFSAGAKLKHIDENGDHMCDSCLTPMKEFDDVSSDKLADVDEIENPYGGNDK